MIRVQVTDSLVEEAHRFIDDIDSTHFQKRADYKEEHLLLGAIGEVGVIDYFWNNDLLAFKNDGRSSDVRLYSGQTIEVKTQRCTSVPKMSYMVNFGARKKDIEKSDFFFFTRVQFVAGTPEAIWLLGGCSWDKFFRMATFHQQGETMMNLYDNGETGPSNRFYNTDCYTLPISQLAPPSAALKHFKSLQTKEEAQ